MSLDEAHAAMIARYEAFCEEMRNDPGSLFARLDKPLPRRKRLYYAFCRKLRSNWRYRLRNAWQRARRGYGDGDRFDLDDYLTSWLPRALRESGQHSYPMRVFDHDGSLLYDSDGDWETPDDALDLWRQTLERMAQGFEAEDLLAGYGGFGAEEAETEVQRIRDEGLQLFTRNFGSLWD